jgi:hypothetical protein
MDCTSMVLLSMFPSSTSPHPMFGDTRLRAIMQSSRSSNVDTPNIQTVVYVAFLMNISIYIYIIHMDISNIENTYYV